jgi:hypothetical protein
VVLLDALAPGGRLASLSDSLEVSCVCPPNGYRIVDPVAEAVGKNHVVEAFMVWVPKTQIRTVADRGAVSTSVCDVRVASCGSSERSFRVSVSFALPRV